MGTAAPRGRSFIGAMLKQGYWLTEHLAISLILKEVFARYARSFIYTEQDEGDLTYFLLYHLDVIRRALLGQGRIPEQEVARVDAYAGPDRSRSRRFNHRQVALLQSASRNPSNHYTAESHMNYHAVSKQTARNTVTNRAARSARANEDQVGNCVGSER